MQLYYRPGACSLAPHLLLEWIGAPFYLEKADLNSEHYRTINPAGTVPALVLNSGQVITQCAAILEYLSQRFAQTELHLPELNLSPVPELQADLHQWACFITGDLHPAFSLYFVPQRYTASNSPQAATDIQHAALTLIEQRLNLIDQKLRGRSHPVDNQRTYIDAYLLPILRWGRAILPEGLHSTPALERFLNELENDPITQRVLAHEGLL